MRHQTPGWIPEASLLASRLLASANQNQVQGSEDANLIAELDLEPEPCRSWEGKWEAMRAEAEHAAAKADAAEARAAHWARAAGLADVESPITGWSIRNFESSVAQDAGQKCTDAFFSFTGVAGTGCVPQGKPTSSPHHR